MTPGGEVKLTTAACCLLLAGAALSHACMITPDDPADLVLERGRIYTLDWGDPGPEGEPAPDAPYDAAGWRPDAQALAIRGDRIVAVGDDDEIISGYVGPDTEVIDLGGATVLPGLVESHAHAAGLGRSLRRLDLRGVVGEEDAVELVVAAAANRPEGEWILGWGFNEGEWATHGYPDNDLLSQQVPDHPVVLRGLHSFATWANDRALSEAGIDQSTPDIAGGEIQRGPDGEPTGIFLNRASGILDAATPPETPEQLQEALRLGLQELASDGYVRVHEAGVGQALLDAMRALDARGELPVRLFAMLSARDVDLVEPFLEDGPPSPNPRAPGRGWPFNRSRPTTTPHWARVVPGCSKTTATCPAIGARAEASTGSIRSWSPP